jgi:hypothetical protein
MQEVGHVGSWVACKGLGTSSNGLCANGKGTSIPGLFACGCPFVSWAHDFFIRCSVGTKDGLHAHALLAGMSGSHVKITGGCVVCSHSCVLTCLLVTRLGRASEDRRQQRRGLVEIISASFSCGSAMRWLWLLQLRIHYTNLTRLVAPV